MVAFFTPPPFMNGKKALSIEPGGNANVSSGATPTFASCAIGAASSDRWVVAFVWCNRGTASAGFALNSATIGGISATIINQISSNYVTCAMIMAKVPTGTTADIVLNWAGNPGSGSLVKWIVVRGASALSVSGQNAVAAAANGARSIALSVAKGGVIFAASCPSNAAAITSSAFTDSLTTDTGTSPSSNPWISVYGTTNGDGSTTVAITSAWNLIAVGLAPA